MLAANSPVPTMTQHVASDIPPIRQNREPLLAVCAMLIGCLIVLPAARTQEPAVTTKPSSEKDEKDGSKAPEKEKPLYEQEPFDIVILDEANKNEPLKVLPLNLPNRQLPTNR